MSIKRIIFFLYVISSFVHGASNCENAKSNIVQFELKDYDNLIEEITESSEVLESAGVNLIHIDFVFEDFHNSFEFKKFLRKIIAKSPTILSLSVPENWDAIGGKETIDNSIYKNKHITTASATSLLVENNKSEVTTFRTSCWEIADKVMSREAPKLSYRGPADCPEHKKPIFLKLVEAVGCVPTQEDMINSFVKRNDFHLYGLSIKSLDFDKYLKYDLQMLKDNPKILKKLKGKAVLMGIKKPGIDQAETLGENIFGMERILSRVSEVIHNQKRKEFKYSVMEQVFPFIPEGD